MSRKTPILRAALVAALGAALAGCSFNKLVADQMAGSLKDMQAAFEREESPKQAREASPALLSQLDGFIAASPKNPDLLLAGAEMNATAAFGLFELEDEDWARAVYKKARRYALRALAEADEDLHRVVTTGDETAIEKALVDLEPGDDRIPALFWTGFAWGSYINLTKDDTDAVADLPRVVAIMERLVQVAPDFYHAGPHLFFAVFYSSRGPAIGGDLEKAKLHYDEVFARTKGRLLMAYVLYAEFYCVALGGTQPEPARKQFTWALQKVLDAPLDIWPEQTLATALAKQSAEELLPELDDLIFPPLE